MKNSAASQRLMFLRLVVCAQLSHPDIAEPHRVVVVLQYQRILRGLRHIVRHLSIHHRAHRLLVVLHKHSVEDNRDDRGLQNLSPSRRGASKKMS